MVGVIQTEFDLPRKVMDALANLSSPDLDDLAFEVGQLIEGQTQERIATGKAAPDGTPWPAWSADYAATRSAHHSLLVGQGNPGLLDSVQNYTTGAEAKVGTNLVYGATHQFGDDTRGIPQREYLGLSAADRAEVEEFVVDRLEDVVR